jgi:hypothetical protein
MNYTDLKHGQKVNVYIPAMKSFYKMDVATREFGNDKLGGFSITNYCTGKRNRIEGHEFLGIVRNQEDVDNFFYIQKEPFTSNEGDLSFEKADAHYVKNGKGWIF